MLNSQSVFPRVGVAYRQQLHNMILDNIDIIDVIEVNVDQYLSADVRHKVALEAMVRKGVVVAHGIGLSLGTAEPVDVTYLTHVAEVLSRLSATYYSEHIAFTRAGGLESGALLPLPRNKQSIDQIVSNLDDVRAIIKIPIILENIACYFDYDHQKMSEIDFINTILDETDCGLLLDLQNLYANSRNYNFDPYDFVSQLRSGAVKTLHVAGGKLIDGLYVDDHGHPIADEVFDLVRHTLRIHEPANIIFERDNRIDAVSEIVSDFQALRISAGQLAASI